MSSIEHLITVADLEKFPDDDGNRYELIEGELYVSTAAAIPHQLVLVNLLTAFTNYLKNKFIREDRSRRRRSIQQFRRGNP